MEVSKVLRMSEGDGEASYAQNSLIQKKIMSTSKLLREEAIFKVYESFPAMRRFAIADLGCSSSPNTLSLIHEIITANHNIRRESSNPRPLDFQVYLNDLTGNDFNTIFKCLPSFYGQLKVGEGYGRCFVHGVPGSFYDRLFENNSLHFVHSSNSLHFLSQVPKGLGRDNKGDIYLSSSSPASVIRAYYQQFQTDFTNFLRHRSEELLTGGCMVLTLVCRKSDDPTIKEGQGGYYFNLLGLALNQMVSEGLIEEEKLDTFNVPEYGPSPSEIKIAVKKEGSFAINCMQVSEVDWEESAGGGGKELGHVAFEKSVRTAMEAMLVHHFGEDLDMDEVFRRYRQIIADRMAKEKTVVVVVTVSLTKTI